MNAHTHNLFFFFSVFANRWSSRIRYSSNEFRLNWFRFDVFIWRESFQFRMNSQHHEQDRVKDRARERERQANRNILIKIQRNNRKYSSIIYLLFQFWFELLRRLRCGALDFDVRFKVCRRNTKFESILPWWKEKDGKFSVECTLHKISIKIALYTSFMLHFGWELYVLAALMAVCTEWQSNEKYLCFYLYFLLSFLL